MPILQRLAIHSFFSRIVTLFGHSVTHSKCLFPKYVPPSPSSSYTQTNDPLDTPHHIPPPHRHTSLHHTPRPPHHLTPGAPPSNPFPPSALNPLPALPHLKIHPHLPPHARRNNMQHRHPIHLPPRLHHPPLPTLLHRLAHPNTPRNPQRRAAPRPRQDPLLRLQMPAVSTSAALIFEHRPLGLGAG